MWHLEDLKILEALQRHGSIRKASEHVSLTPSSLNRRLLAIEERLKTQIFDRTPLGLRLNSSGDLVLKNIRKQLIETEVLKSNLSSQQHECEGHVRICADNAVLEDFLPKEIAKFKGRFPDVTFTLSDLGFETAQSVLEEYRADLIICHDVVENELIEVVASTTQKLYALVPRKSPLFDEDSVTFSQLAALEFALPRSGTWVRNTLEKVAGDLGFALNVAFESSSYSTLNEISNQLGLAGFRLANDHDYYADLKDFKLLEIVDLEPIQTFGAILRGQTISAALLKFGFQLAETISSSEFEIKLLKNGNEYP